MKGDVFVECNEAMVRILGAGSKEELIGLTPLGSFTGKSTEWIGYAYKRALQALYVL